ncbi:MAG: hypothetical protein HY778_16420 [Betaproteobacteria bacterium]|nr:hypothetical protein [Betaproteobacteria bacterium]
MAVLKCKASLNPGTAAAWTSEAQDRLADYSRGESPEVDEEMVFGESDAQ